VLRQVLPVSHVVLVRPPLFISESCIAV
jgi:hypothetical protein